MTIDERQTYQRKLLELRDRRDTINALSEGREKSAALRKLKRDIRAVYIQAHRPRLVDVGPVVVITIDD